MDSDFLYLSNVIFGLNKLIFDRNNMINVKNL